MNNIKDEIQKLEEQIETLPKGTLVYKTINGIKQPYLQQTINGKPVSKYIKKDGRDEVLEKIELRNNLIKKLNELKSSNEYNQINTKKRNLNFYSNVYYSDDLKRYIQNVKKYKRRYCYKEIEDYLYNDIFSKVFILYGLRRTGKTTLIKQAILNMNEEDFNKTAFIQITKQDSLANLNRDLKTLLNNDFKYVFIDEVTLLDEFIEGAALLPDIFVSSGMKIVLSGTDSLGFWLSEDEQLYDRTVMCHTTFISYSEFENILGIKGIDNYICYGGTMCLDGKHYNQENIFKDEKSIDEYVDSAIAHNIQHSLKYYEYGGHFRNLIDLFDNNELTSAINRVVEDTNHRFTIDVLTNEFKSHDLGISARNLRKDNDILDNIDINEFTNNLKNALEILNKNEQDIEIKEAHKIEIEEYLYALDLIKYIDLKTIPSSNIKKKMVVITQPGLRYSQAKLLVETLLYDTVFKSLSLSEKNQIFDRILNEIKGRMMEEIILLETSIINNKNKVFKLSFDRGEFDMVISNYENLTCNIYEIKHSDKIIEEQYKNLIDLDKCDKTEFNYGKIMNKYVIYRGESKKLDNGIIYLNVEEYLKGLYE